MSTCFLELGYVCVCVTQSCPTLCSPVDYSPQAPLSMEFSRKNTGVGSVLLARGSFQPRGWAWVSSEPMGKPRWSRTCPSVTSWLCAHHGGCQWWVAETKVGRVWPSWLRQFWLDKLLRLCAPQFPHHRCNSKDVLVRILVISPCREPRTAPMKGNVH